MTFILTVYPHSPAAPSNKNNLTSLSSFYGSEAVDITVTFTSSQNTVAFWMSFKQTLLYPPDSLPLNVTFFSGEVIPTIGFECFAECWYVESLHHWELGVSMSLVEPDFNSLPAWPDWNHKKTHQIHLLMHIKFTGVGIVIFPLQKVRGALCCINNKCVNTGWKCLSWLFYMCPLLKTSQWLRLFQPLPNAN